MAPGPECSGARVAPMGAPQQRAALRALMGVIGDRTRAVTQASEAQPSGVNHIGKHELSSEENIAVGLGHMIARIGEGAAKFELFRSV